MDIHIYAYLDIHIYGTINFFSELRCIFLNFSTTRNTYAYGGSGATLRLLRVKPGVSLNWSPSCYTEIALGGLALGWVSLQEIVKVLKAV